MIRIALISFSEKNCRELEEGFFNRVQKLTEAANRTGDEEIYSVFRTEEISFSWISLKHASNIEELRPDADILIARGYNVHQLLRINKVPVVETLDAFDLLEALQRAKAETCGEKIALIGSRHLMNGARSLISLVGVNADVFYLSDNDYASLIIAQRIDAIYDKGYRILIGGKSLCDYAKRRGMQTFRIGISPESREHIITSIINLILYNRKEVLYNESIRTTVDLVADGIISFDKQFRVFYVNRSASTILNLGEDTLVGRSAMDAAALRPFSRLISAKEDIYHQSIQYGKINLAVSCFSYYRHGESLGRILTFQDVTLIRQIESSIRQQNRKLGYVAHHSFKDIIGASPAIRGAIDTARHFAASTSNILLYGETGTGKELFAQSIHNASSRSIGPFVAINCAAISDSLLESEMFGYESGAFTGAAKGGKTGLFEQAHKGTLFLDEVSEIPLSLQGKLLRAIQEKEIRRIGGDKVIPIDVRIIAATNRDLAKRIREGSFREDLYYRLNVLPVDIPSLRERKGDSVRILQHYLDVYTEENHMDSFILTEPMRQILDTYSWPGNIRELVNVFERIIALSGRPPLDEKTLLQALQLDSVKATNIEENEKERIGSLKASPAVSEEASRILSALEKAKYNRTKAAEFLGISRTTLWNRMRELGL